MKKRNRSVIVTGYIGLKGTAILSEKYKEKIDSHYPIYLSSSAEHIADSVCDNMGRALEIIKRHVAQTEETAEEGAEELPVIEIAEGGFLTAMWEIARRAGQGFTVDLRLVPLKQETVEICELLEVNPYHLYSGGAVVAVVSDGRLLAEQLEKNDIPVTIIGYTNSSKAHILMNDGTESHLNRPEPDELVRLGLMVI